MSSACTLVAIGRHTQTYKIQSPTYVKMPFVCLIDTCGFIASLRRLRLLLELRSCTLSRLNDSLQKISWSEQVTRVAVRRSIEELPTCPGTASKHTTLIEKASRYGLHVNLFASAFKWLQSAFTYHILFAGHLNFSAWFTKNINIPVIK